MKANEFVKKFGWDKTKEVIAMSSDAVVDGGDGEVFHVNDLKRLVESWGLVESYGGLHGAKNTYKLLKSSLDIGLYHGMDNVDAVSEVPKLEQAIKDVESCQ